MRERPVLVVDDEQGMRDTIAEVLSSVGVEACTAGSAAEALALIGDLGPAVAIVDYRLPDSRGTALAAELKAIDPDLQVLVMTGYATLEGAVEAVSHADAFLTKPVPPEQLLREVRGALERRRLVDENRELVERLREANEFLEEQAFQRTAELAGLLQIGEATSRAHDLDGLVSRVIEVAQRVTGAESAVVHLVHRPAPDTYPLAPVDGRAGGTSGESVAGAPGAQREPVAEVALTAAGEHVGTLRLESPTRAPDDFLATLGALVAVAVRNAERMARERATIEELRAADRMKDEFLMMASHELRTPLTAISGFAEALHGRWGGLDEPTKLDMVDRLRRNALGMGDMVERLLDVARLEAGRVEVRPAALPLAQAVTREVENLAPVLGDHDVVVGVPEALEVWADPAALSHVLGNLLTNAAKYSPAGAPIEVRAEPAGGSEVVVSVRDHGTGIPEQEQEHVFDRFYRASDQPAGWRGFGVGLGIARRYVELLGGQIWLDSTPGVGSTFAFSLPTGPSDRRPSRVGTAQERPARPSIPNPESMPPSTTSSEPVQ